MGLHEQHMLPWIDAAGEKDGRHFSGLLCQACWVLPDGNGVQVYNAPQTLMVRLQRHPIADCAEIVAECGDAGRLNTREDTRHGRVLWVIVRARKRGESGGDGGLSGDTDVRPKGGEPALAHDVEDDTLIVLR